MNWRFLSKAVLELATVLNCEGTCYHQWQTVEISSMNNNKFSATQQFYDYLLSVKNNWVNPFILLRYSRESFRIYEEIN